MLHIQMIVSRNLRMNVWLCILIGVRAEGLWPKAGSNSQLKPPPNHCQHSNTLCSCRPICADYHLLSTHCELNKHAGGGEEAASRTTPSTGAHPAVTSTRIFRSKAQPMPPC